MSPCAFASVECDVQLRTAVHLKKRTLGIICTVETLRMSSGAPGHLSYRDGDL
jgi:hypothetical protein